MPTNVDTVIELDRTRMKAMAQRDFATLDELLAHDLVYVHSSAAVQSKQSLLSNMRSGSTVYAVLEPTDVKAQDLGDAVVLTGTARADGVANGSPLSFSVRFVDMYTLRDGRWQMVAWQSTRIS